MPISMESEYTHLFKNLGEDYEIDTETQLREVLDEHQEIMEFFAASLYLKERARQENKILKFHVFTDNTDDFLKNAGEALLLYLEHRQEHGNTRLYYELQCPCIDDIDATECERDQEHDDTGMFEENAMISFGAFPD